MKDNMEVKKLVWLEPAKGLGEVRSMVDEYIRSKFEDVYVEGYMRNSDDKLTPFLKCCIEYVKKIYDWFEVQEEVNEVYYLNKLLGGERFRYVEVCFDRGIMDVELSALSNRYSMRFVPPVEIWRCSLEKIRNRIDEVKLIIDEFVTFVKMYIEELEKAKKDVMESVENSQLGQKVIEERIKRKLEE